MPGRVELVTVRPSRKDDPIVVEEAEAVAGRGLVGDHYGKTSRSKSGRRALTLIEREAYAHLEAEGLAVDEPLLRRNLIVTGIDLNALVGKEFTVGDVRCRGSELCHPCRDIEKQTHEGVLKALVMRGGLCAEVLSDGVISTGDQITPLA